ncbi:hypothetical protein D3C73_1261910 [compost metagenome]
MIRIFTFLLCCTFRLLQLPLQRFADPLAHFGGCSLSEGGYQQPVHAEAVLLPADFADNPLYEHRRFA